MHAYLALIAAFVDERLSANEFEAVFLALFKNDPGGRPEPIYVVLDTLFGDVDAYDEHPHQPSWIDGDELRHRAGLALARLRAELAGEDGDL